MNRTTVAAAAIGATLIGAPVQPVAAYPIDCAILLCLAGGFPPSAECTAAKAEMIRRITPWPVEPPLQLWNCPMSVPADVAQAVGMVNVGLGPDGLTPEVRKYRDGIEIYHIEKYENYTSGKDENDHFTDRTKVGAYDEQGNFFWRGSSFANGPDWLRQAADVGGVAYTYCQHETDNGWCKGSKETRYRNEEVRHLRGIGMRFQDYEGNFHTEFVRY